MELNPDTPLHWEDWTILLRLGAAGVLGLLLGLDRELKGHDAGLRTHGLICFSSAVMTVCALALFHQLDAEGSRMDPLRIFEGAGAFVGIIAAGLIVVSKGAVHNLTTAANIWLAAVIGIACGAGQWPIVLISTVVSVLLLTGLALVERRWLKPIENDRGQQDGEPP